MGVRQMLIHLPLILFVCMSTYFQLLELLKQILKVVSCHKDLYRLNDYTSEYNDKYPGKNKGSGIGLYIIHTDYIFNKNEEFCRCFKNIESLFATITYTEAPITVGVVYRPPWGSVGGFVAKWETILNSLPKANVHVLGDFNLDLLKLNKE